MKSLEKMNEKSGKSKKKLKKVSEKNTSCQKFKRKKKAIQKTDQDEDDNRQYKSSFTKNCIKKTNSKS